MTNTAAPSRDEELVETIEERVPHAGAAEVADIADMLSEIEGSNSGAEARVYRVVKGMRSTPFMFSFMVGSKSYTDLMAELRDVHGGGEFRMDVRALTGRKSWLARQTFSVIEPQKKPEENSEDSIMKMMSRMLEASEKRTQEMFARMEERERESRESKPTAVDPLEQIKKIAEIMRALQPPPQSQVKSESVSIMEAMTLYDQIRERAREDVNGPQKPWYADAATGAVALLANALPGLEARALQAAGDTATVSAAQPAGTPALSGAEPVLGLSLFASAPASVILGALRQKMQSVGIYVAAIEEQAARNVEPSELAEQIIEAVPDSVSDKTLLAFLQRPDLLAMWEALVPAASARHGYYGRVVSAMIAQVSQVGDDPKTDT